MAISITGAVAVTAQNATTVTTAARTTAAGCVLVACNEWYTSGGTANCTVSDSKGNTWTQVAANTNYNATVRRIKAWTAVPPDATKYGASHTFSATRGVAEYTDINLCVVEIASADTASPVDTAALSAASTGNSTAPSNTTGTLTRADSAIVGMVGWWNTPTFTQDAAFSTQCNLDSGGDDEKMAVGTRVVSATTAVTFAPTLSAATNWGCLAIPIKGASAPPPPPSFVGYSILDQTVVQGEASLSYDVSGKFSNATTFSAVGTWPTGLSISSAGVISGTVSGATGDYILQVQGAGTGTPATSNTWVCTVVAAGGVAIARRSIGAIGDYATPWAWNAAAPANLTTINHIWYGGGQNQEWVIAGSTNSPNYAAQLSGSVTDQTRYKRLGPAPGCSFRDHATVRSNRLAYDGTKGMAIRFTDAGSAAVAIFEQGSVIEDLQIKHSNAGGTAGGYALFTSQLSTITFRNVLVESPASGLHNFTAAISGTHKIIQCVFINTSPTTGPDHIVEGTAGCNFYGNTIAAVGARATYGLSGGNNAGTGDELTQTADFVDNVIVGCNTLRQFNANGTRSNNFTDATTYPSGFSPIAFDTSTGTGFENITLGTHDLRIKPTSALVNAGITESLLGGVDISRRVRPQGAAPDVGAWEANLTVLANVGDATAAGHPATVTLAQTIAATVGNAVAAGHTAAVALHTAVLANVGDAVAAGHPATVQIGTGTTIAAGVGAATAAGHLADVALHLVVAANTGAAVAQGHAATVQTATGITINASMGAAVASGHAAQISVSGGASFGIGRVFRVDRRSRVWHIQGR